ncbi:hypothetical protein ULMS_24920 [Patiriisocius marinistellae]|uniref:Alginate lyase 2 domain-containing protein n=1 Tax=Patiriisocius marinistellae TaxID=2494560 RepID=A0A5J4G0E2_9FLAO|nr:polysaccharide lyase family 7 protein [Patiriisocius marinistellae]GEQ86984.1 hypothetical protein ULMS_24920 [Patiriisocius marinistellae]
MKNIVYIIVIFFVIVACKDKVQNISEEITQTNEIVKYPSDVLPFMNQWKILLGDGTDNETLVNYTKKDFFYVENDSVTNWVVYKTPNSGITSKNSGNTRTELGQKKRWIPETGGKLTGTLKVQHVSTTGDARVAASYSVVVGQIHSDEGHKNEPLKIFYKKFPGHEKGSVFWNYEINTEGDNSKRWDFSTAVWGHDMSVIGEGSNTYPKEPENGIALGEEFAYEINVFKGIMYLTFTNDTQDTKTFTKNLLVSDYSKKSNIPQQTITLFSSIGQDGTERANAYAGELQFFKQGAYNQTNGKNPKTNMVWSTGSEIYEGDIKKQYENGSYAEVWFKEASLSSGTAPNN